MAAVITSQDASERFLEAPEEFAGEFSLDRTDLAMLMEMADDLTSLTSSFVSKRATTLRWNARRTLEMLGREGDELLEDFVETHPMSDQFKIDAAEFGDFVIEATAESVAENANDVPARMIAGMARFERHRSRSFWDAVARAADPDDPVAPPGSVRLAAGANLGSFEWDLRLPYRHRVRPLRLLPSDPCELLFFHAGASALLRTLRLRPAEAAFVASMPAGESVELASLRETASHEIDVDRLCRRLSWEEAVQWV